MSEYKAQQMAKNHKLVTDFCAKYGFKMTELNHGYQMRIEDIFDVYPVRQRWHFLVDGTRGSWTDLQDLRRVMLKKLETPELRNEVEVPEHPLPFTPRPFQRDVLDNYKADEPVQLITGRDGRTRFVGIDMAQEGGDQSTIVQGIADGKGGLKIVSISEFGTWPDYKWYKQPIKWLKWKWLWRKIKRSRGFAEIQSTDPSKTNLFKKEA